MSDLPLVNRYVTSNLDTWRAAGRRWNHPEVVWSSLLDGLYHAVVTLQADTVSYARWGCHTLRIFWVDGSEVCSKVISRTAPPADYTVSAQLAGDFRAAVLKYLARHEHMVQLILRKGE